MVFRWANYKVVPAYTYRIPLEQTDGAIQAAFSSTRRRNIRAALRDSLRVIETDDYSFIERLSLGTYHRQNKKVAVASMRRVLMSSPTATIVTLLWLFVVIRPLPVYIVFTTAIRHII